MAMVQLAVLSIALDAEVMVSFDSHSDNPDEEKDMKLMRVGSERAAEIFLDSWDIVKTTERQIFRFPSWANAQALLTLGLLATYTAQASSFSPI